MTITVLVADDHPIVRSGIVNELRYHPDIEVIGEADSGDKVLPLVKELDPHVLVLDIQMPGMKGVRVVEELAGQDQAPQVLILTAYGDPENVLGMLKAGAKGYLLKDSSPDEIAEGIRAVAEGKTWLCPAVSQVLLESVNSGNSPIEAEALTGREVEVLQYVAQGYNNAQIAERLKISEGTVKNHMTSLYDKLRLHTRAEVVAWAWQHRLAGA